MKALEEIMQDPSVSKTVLKIVCDEEGIFQGEILGDGKIIIASGKYSHIKNVLGDLETEAQRIIGDIDV